MMKGYLTVSVTYTLVLVISLCLTLIEGVRQNTMMLEAACAVDTGMNSILAEYHRELLKQYDLFFIDTSYGGGVPDYGQTLQHLEEYVTGNLEGPEYIRYFGKDLIGLHWREGKVLALSVASDDKGEVLRRQIVDYMEDKVGIHYLQEILDQIVVVENYSLNGDWFQEMESEAKRELEEWKTTELTQNDEGVECDISFWEESFSDMQGKILELLVGLELSSDETIRCEDYLSHRELLTGTGVNESYNYEPGAWEQLMLNEYVLDKTGCYGNIKEEGRLKYQTEYILSGNGSDAENIIAVVNRIFVVRESANAIHIMSDSEKMDLLKILSDGLSALVTLPELSPLFQTLFVVVWAGLEGLWDTEQILDGDKIPLIKSKENWHYGLSGLFDLGEIFGVEEEVEPDITQSPEEYLEILWGYTDYLRMFLLFQNEETTTFRLMDVMEMDIRLTAGNAQFRMDGCIDSIKVQMELESDYGCEFVLIRNYGY